MLRNFIHIVGNKSESESKSESTLDFREFDELNVYFTLKIVGI